MAGASTGPSLDGALARADAVSFRTPYQSEPELRTLINEGKVQFFDMHLSMMPQAIRYGHLGPVHWAVVEACDVTAGGGIVLFGPCGTGKDHLLVAAAREVIAKHSARVEWRNGMDLFGDFRDLIANHGTEREFLTSLVHPDVLVISDPLPPAGSLTEFQSSLLLRILDRRYRQLKPTWISVNVANGQEADARMGAACWDRIKEGALAAYCSWPSWRRPRQVIANEK